MGQIGGQVLLGERLNLGLAPGHVVGRPRLGVGCCDPRRLGMLMSCLGSGEVGLGLRQRRDRVGQASPGIGSHLGEVARFVAARLRDAERFGGSFDGRVERRQGDGDVDRLADRRLDLVELEARLDGAGEHGDSRAEVTRRPDCGVAIGEPGKQLGLVR